MLDNSKLLCYEYGSYIKYKLTKMYISNKSCSPNRNRAIHGDIVVVELLHKSQWKGRSISIRNGEEGNSSFYRSKWWAWYINLISLLILILCLRILDSYNKIPWSTHVTTSSIHAPLPKSNCSSLVIRETLMHFVSLSVALNSNNFLFPTKSFYSSLNTDIINFTLSASFQRALKAFLLNKYRQS